MLCYHFCSKDFLEELKEKNIVIPDKLHFDETSNRNGAYDYLFNKLNVSSLFFAWGSESNKDEDIIYDKSGDFILLTFDAPDEECIVTDYYNWCDVIFCLDNNNSLETAEEIAQDEMKCSFDVVYNSMFGNDRKWISQVLLKSMNYKWVRCIETVSKKII